MTSYVKEVERLENEGIPAEAAVQLFQVLTERLEDVSSSPEVDEFQRKLLDLRKHDRRYFRQVIDDVCSEFPFPIPLNWRNVKFEPIRINRCELCGNYFYDVSRNGKKITCYNGGRCEHEYEVRRHREGTLLDPIYKRRKEEIPIDMSPSEDDSEGWAELNEMEMTAFYKPDRIV
ncbi:MULTISPECIES: CGNR zinc finger domain-containing protein [unclassified Oceanobacillus]|uniref:CGNR zinc finger domain-containing protein n=1 Tax=unclassified Oceanobacillus TaxID=2630292 RepID=UPI00300E1EE4